MSLEGKIANVCFAYYNCGKCGKRLPEPESVVVGNKNMNSTMAWICRTYLGTKYYVYETKNGYGICYCSKYCRNKHNHRFRK